MLDIALNGMGPDGHTASLFPGHPLLHADGVAVGVRDSPKPPPERITLTLGKLNESRRILLLVTGEGKAPMLARVIAGPGPRGARRRCWTATSLEIIADDAALGAGLMRRAAGLARPPRRDRVVARPGKHTGRTDVPLTDDGRERAPELAGAPRRARRSRSCSSRPLVARARDRASWPASATAAEVRDDLLEWDYGDYEGITTPEIREERPDWYLWRDGVPDGETPDDVGARADRVIERGRWRSTATSRSFAHGHVLRVLGARWIERARRASAAAWR